MPTADPLLTPVEVAAIFRVDRSTISRWGKEGVLPTVRVGGTVRFRSVDVQALLDTQSADEAAS